MGQDEEAEGKGKAKIGCRDVVGGRLRGKWRVIQGAEWVKEERDEKEDKGRGNAWCGVEQGTARQDGVQLYSAGRGERTVEGKMEQRR